MAITGVPFAGTRFPMMHVVSLVCRTVSSRSSTQVRSALGNRFGLGMTLAAVGPTTDGRENPTTDTSRIVHSQNRKTFKLVNPEPEAGCPPEDPGSYIEDV